VNAQSVINLVKQNKPPLYAGLVQDVLDIVNNKNLDLCIPDEYKGDLNTRLREYFADCEDPRSTLLELLGKLRVIELARKKDILEDNAEPIEVVLKSYGFNIPETPSGGAYQTIQTLGNYIERIKTATDKVELIGILNDGMAIIEKTIKEASWTWGLALFGPKRDEYLADIAGKSIERLSMGDIVSIYCKLPYYCVDDVGEDCIERAIEIFNKPHPYTPKKHKQFLQEKIVSFRNKVEHNTNNYREKTSLRDMREDFSEVLKLAQEKLQELFDENALPKQVCPIRKSIDQHNRVSVELKKDDGTTQMIYITGDLELGKNYLILPPKGNPRPVDPPLYLRSEVFD
jgi:hypothetical protein